MAKALDYKKARESAMERFPNAEENAYRLDSIAALLGANSEWDGADFLDAIHYEVDGARAPGIPRFSDTDQASLKFWRRIADAYGVAHDGE